MTGSRRIAILAFCFLQAILIAPRAAQAHEARPAYLEVKETAPTRFSLLWRTPVMASTRLPIVLTIPGVRNRKTPEIEELSDSFVERRWIDAGPEGLAGKRIEFVGLQLTITDEIWAVDNADSRFDFQPTRSAHPEHPFDSRLLNRGDDGRCSPNLVVIQVRVVPSGIESADNRIVSLDQRRKRSGVIHVASLRGGTLAFFKLLRMRHNRCHNVPSV
jgi:hypothetical protein